MESGARLLSNKKKGSAYGTSDDVDPGRLLNAMKLSPWSNALKVPMPMAVAADDAPSIEDEGQKEYKYLNHDSLGKGWTMFRKMYKSSRAWEKLRTTFSGSSESIPDTDVEKGQDASEEESSRKNILAGFLVGLAIAVDGLRPITQVWAKDGQPKYPFDFSVWIVMVKAMVVGFSLFLYKLAPEEQKETKNSSADNFRLSVYLIPPTILYITSDALNFVMFEYISASTFSIVKQSRLVIVGLLFRFVLKRYLSQIQWIAILQLLMASMLFEADVFSAKTTPDGKDNKNEMFGIAILLFKCLLDSLAIIWMDKFFKLLSTSGFPYPLQQLYFSVYGFLIGVLFFMYTNSGGLGTNGLFFGWNTGAWVSAIITAFYGLLVSIVLRYLDSLVKMLQSLLAVVVTICLDYVMFGESIDLVKIIAILFVLLSVFLYKIGTVKIKKK